MPVNKSSIIKALLIVIAILVVILCSGFMRQHNATTYMPGFWTAETEFLKTSGLSAAYVLFEPKSPDGTMTGFLTMLSSGSDKVVSNQKITMKHLNPSKVGDNMYILKNVDIEYDNSDVMPNKLNIDLDINSGIMVMSDNKKLYAVFVKDNETTSNIS